MALLDMSRIKCPHWVYAGRCQLLHFVRRLNLEISQQLNPTKLELHWERLLSYIGSSHAVSIHGQFLY